MDSNTHSTSGPDGLGAVVAELQGLAAQAVRGLADGARAERLLTLWGLGERREGQWLADLAALDARGAAGADQGVPAGSTPPAWCAPPGPCTAVPWPEQARPWPRGRSRRPMPRCWPPAPTTSPIRSRPRPNRCWWRRPAGWTRRGCGGPWPICGWSPTPRPPTTKADRQHQQRGLWLASTWEGMVAVNGLLEPEAGQALVAALEPLARPTSADDPRSGGQRRADALVELARRSLESGRLPQTGGVRPQLTVTVDLDSLLGHHQGLGGETGGAAPLDPEACRRLACDGAITRVLVSRHPHDHLSHPSHGPDAQAHPATRDQNEMEGFGGRLGAVLALLPPILGGAPTPPLEVGRTSRVVQPAQRAALAVRDGGCGFPGCDRPLAWCEAHHLRHWLHGGRTDLANLALVCRAHHRAVHEGGWRLARHPDGQLTATPPHRKHQRAPAAA